MDLSLGLEGTVVIITGAGGQIGEVIVEAFLSAGCRVGAVDIVRTNFKRQHENLLWLLADTTDESAMALAWEKVENHFSAIPTACVSAAALDLSLVPRHQSIISMPVQQFRRTMDVVSRIYLKPEVYLTNGGCQNVTGTFITAQTWLRRLDLESRTQQRDSGPKSTPEASQRLNNVSFIIIGSEAGVLGVPGNADYAASKSAVQYGLTLSLAPDAARICPHARVNAVCPGAVDTERFRRECADDNRTSLKWTEAEATVALKKPVKIEDIAKQCLFLTSERWSSSTTAQFVRIDGGKSGRLYWNKEGKAMW